MDVNSPGSRLAQTTAPHFGIYGTSAVALALGVLLAGCSLNGKSLLPWSQASTDKTPVSSSTDSQLAGTAQPAASRAAKRSAADKPVALASFDRPADRSFAASHGPGGGQVAHANSKDFDQLVLRSDVPVLVDFYADWCGPCKRLAPSLDELAQELPNARVVKVNIDDSPELARRYQVGPIPSLRVFRNGEVSASHEGFASKQELQSLLSAP